jgi:hypothetical protein
MDRSVTLTTDHMESSQHCYKDRTLEERILEEQAHLSPLSSPHHEIYRDLRSLGILVVRASGSQDRQ